MGFFYKRKTNLLKTEMRKSIQSVWDKKAVRIGLLIVLDIISVFLSELLTLWFRFDMKHIQVDFFSTFSEFFLLDAIIVVIIFMAFGLYTSVWKYASIPELISNVLAVATADILIFTYKHILLLPSPRSFWLIFPVILLIFTCGVRFSYRIIREILYNFGYNKRQNVVMLIGAGNAAKMLLDEMTHSERYIDSRIACIIDDNRNKIGTRIRGIPVVGTRKDIKTMADKYLVNEIIVAIPSASKETLSKIYAECQKTGCEVKILPSIYLDMDQDKESIVAQIRPIKYEDFLGRDEIVVNNEEINDNLTNKTILVTGGGGSIGSELCRQIAKAKPELLIIFDIYENNAYEIQQELYRNYPELKLQTIIGSVRDYKRLEKVFQEYHPEQVYHAAAHKHVPLMEVSPNEAIKNNCLGTLNTVRLADKYGVKKFVLVSTDKAVRPTNIMGASKRICEMIVQTYNKQSKTDYVAVRFGNVLGSNGSVIPLFLKQIEAGGPVTVTHKDITRYFMTIPEAVSLILQASAYAEGGEIFVLDMGEPVRIYDLAKKIIRYKGLEPGKDIQIKITGLRPGEKLYEEMLMEEEGLKETPNKLIHIGQPIDIPRNFLSNLDNLIDSAEHNSDDIKTQTSKIVNTYQIQKETK